MNNGGIIYMSIFNRDKETVNFYKRENKKLRKELANAMNELNAIHSLKSDYQELITQVRTQQDHYKKLNKQYEDLIKICKEQLSEISTIE